VASGTGDGGADSFCSSKVIPAHANPPDILIVLDKSLSMLAGRWGPSVAAIGDLTTKYQAQVSFGLSIFPHGDGLCDPGILDVPLALNNADAINAFMAMTVPNGVTPTGDTLNNALMELGDRNDTGDALVTPAYVVLVTDGEPDCPKGVDITDLDALAMVDLTSAGSDTVAAAAALKQANIKTYAIGYDLDGVGADLMSMVAAAGGTNDFFKVESPADLDAAFQAITKDVVRCEFDLDQPPDDPNYVLVTIDGKDVKLDSADGWVIDGTKVTLMGGSCNMLKDGSQHVLKASVECTPVQLL
jgi:von Willebrand factor type A domain